MIKLENETGNLILSRYGAAFALGLKGDKEFLRRCFNFCINFGVINSGKYYEINHDFIYVVTSPEKIKNALIEYFAAEMILTKEVSVTCDEAMDYEVVIDEENLKNKSMEKAEKFFNEKIEKQDFMFDMLRDRVKDAVVEYRTL